MDLTSYQTITGITVAAANQTRVTAEITRASRKLETMLGFTLDSNSVNTNFYNELGKASDNYSCPNVDTDNLLDPDAVVTAYRLYDYNPVEIYHHIDPFTTINAVKLVYVKAGAAPNGITLRTFDDDWVNEYQHNNAWSKYLTINANDYVWPLWHCLHTHPVQLAVDAVWQFSTVPDDLLEVWADMVTYYADDKRDVKSESILTHSYQKYGRKEPQLNSENIAIIAKYAGPKGSVARTLVA